jgi:putative addiction module killer protein
MRRDKNATAPKQRLERLRTNVKNAKLKLKTETTASKVRRRPVGSHSGWQFSRGGSIGETERLTRVSHIVYSQSVIEREIKKLELESGRIPFDDWFESLLDQRMRQAVDARVNRMKAGNFGDSKFVGDGVHESRIPIGPGLRLYYAFLGDTIVVLIGGGDKSTQNRDIKRAQHLWKTYEA